MLAEPCSVADEPRWSVRYVGRGGGRESGEEVSLGPFRPRGLLRRVATGARRGPVVRELVGSVVSALSVSRLLRFRLRASAQLGVWAGLSTLTVAVLPV